MIESKATEMQSADIHNKGENPMTILFCLNCY